MLISFNQPIYLISYTHPKIMASERFNFVSFCHILMLLLPNDTTLDDRALMGADDVISASAGPCPPYYILYPFLLLSTPSTYISYYLPATPRNPACLYIIIRTFQPYCL